MERAVTHIKRLATSIASPISSDCDESVRVPRKKRVRKGVLPNRKQQRVTMPNNHGAQRYCVISNKAGIPEQKYMSYSSENCFGNFR